MPVRSTFADLSARGFRNSQGFVRVRDFVTGTGVKTTGAVITDNVIAQAGDLIVVILAADALTATTPTVSSVGDTVGTTYTSMGAIVIAPASPTTTTSTISQVYFGVVPSGTASQTITVTGTWSSASTVAKAMQANSFFNVKQFQVNTRTTSITAATSATLVSGIANTGDIVLAYVSTESNAAPTGASDTIRGTWSSVVGAASSGGNANTNQAVALQYKIVTGQGTQTASWANLGGNSTLHTYVLKGA